MTVCLGINESLNADINNDGREDKFFLNPVNRDVCFNAENTYWHLDVSQPKKLEKVIFKFSFE